eukprot:3049369-Rhodomonas_salina.4
MLGASGMRDTRSRVETPRAQVCPRLRTHSVHSREGRIERRRENANWAGERCVAERGGEKGEGRGRGGLKGGGLNQEASERSRVGKSIAMAVETPGSQTVRIRGSVDTRECGYEGRRQGGRG